MQENKDEVMALQIFYNKPYRRREITHTMNKDMLEILKIEKRLLVPMNVWRAYNTIDNTNHIFTAVGTGRDLSENGRNVGTGRDLSLQSPLSEMMMLVSLIRRITGIDTILSPYDKIVDKNFQDWVFKKQAGNATKFNEEQMQWLRMIKDYVVNSFHIEKDDFDLNPFNREGGLSKMWQLFGDTTDDIINELNEILAA